MKPIANISKLPQHYAANDAAPAVARFVRRARRAALGLTLRAQVLALRYRASSNRRYLAECNPDGLIDSLNVRRFSSDAEADERRANAIAARLQVGQRTKSETTPTPTLWPAVGAALVVLPWVLLFAALRP